MGISITDVETRVCYLCQVEKPIEDFSYKNKSKNTRQYHCTDCKKLYNKQHHIDNREADLLRVAKNNTIYQKSYEEYIISYLLTHPCVDCGETDILVLEFDHVSGDKEYNISQMNRFTLKKLKEELSKCVVRCANCHRRRHAIDNNNYRHKYLMTVSIIDNVTSSEVV